MLLLLSAAVISCFSLSAVDGDTIKCNGQNMRIMGDGQPFKSGVDAPEIGKAACAKERLLGEQAKLGLSELCVSAWLLALKRQERTFRSQGVTSEAGT